MQEIEFNLLTEPWVRVRLPDNTVQEVSLTDALVHAQEYMDLAGEMPTQDAAMLRLLLAVLFTVFSRVNEVGEPEPLEDEEVISLEDIFNSRSLPSNNTLTPQPISRFT